MYKCCKCRATKLNGKKFFEHTQNHISKNFKCEDCKKGFSQQRFLDQHIFAEHGNGKGKRFQCQFENCNFEVSAGSTIFTNPISI